MNDRTQFEDEAEAALIAAFREHNMPVTVTSSRDALDGANGIDNVEDEAKNADDGGGGNGAADLLHRKVPSTVDAAHRKQVSALSSGGTCELDTAHSPIVTGTAGALPVGSSEVTRGAQVVEDSAWSDEYDVQVSQVSSD